MYIMQKFAFTLVRLNLGIFESLYFYLFVDRRLAFARPASIDATDWRIESANVSARSVRPDMSTAHGPYK